MAILQTFARVLRIKLHTVQLHRKKSSLMKHLGETTYGSLKVDPVEAPDLKPIVTQIDEVSARIDLAEQSLTAIRYAGEK